MQATFELILADAKAQVYYWPMRYLVWAIWGLVFAALGMAAMRFVWGNRLSRTEQLRMENRRLRRELDDLEREFKGRG